MTLSLKGAMTIVCRGALIALCISGLGMAGDADAGCSPSRCVVLFGTKKSGGGGLTNCLLSQIGIAILAQAGSCIKVK